MADPYVPGNTLRLALHAQPPSIVDILRVFSPSTLSTVLVVIVPGLTTHQPFMRAVLKVYDRRFAIQPRKEEAAARAWTEDLEKTYQAFAATEEAKAFVTEWYEGEEEPDWSKWSKEQDEAHMQFSCISTYITEKDAYKQLETLQGQQILKLYATATVTCQSSAKPTGEVDEGDLLQIPALLMEYIPGPHLEEFASLNKIPREYWQRIADLTRAVVRSYASMSFANRDARPRNSIASPGPGDDWSKVRVVMVDLGLSYIREDETDFEWGRKKHDAGEEDKLCHWFKRDMAKMDFDLVLLGDTEPYDEFGWYEDDSCRERLLREKGERLAREAETLLANGHQAWKLVLAAVKETSQSSRA